MEKDSTASQDSPYLNENPTLKSKYIYLYYLRHGPETTAAYLVRFSSQIDRNQAVVEIRKLAAALRSGAPIKDYQGEKIGAVKWKHKSFFAVVLDDTNQKLAAKNAVSFVRLPEETGNHTFKDGVDISGLGTGSTGFVCINHMKNKRDGGDLGNEEESFWVTINHSTSGNRHDNSNKSHADSGTNTGQPIP